MKTRTERQKLTRERWRWNISVILLLCYSDSAGAYNSLSEAESKMDGNRIPNVMAIEFMLRKRSLISVQVLSTVARNMLTQNSSRLIWGSRPEKEGLVNFWPRQRWGRVHCTPCTLYCYSTCIRAYLCQNPRVLYRVCYLGWIRSRN